MRRKKQKSLNNKKDFILVDGYYMPKEIAMAFKQLKQYCIFELMNTLHSFCATVHHIKSDSDEYIEAIGNDGAKYLIPLTPQIISQLEKAIGTKKLDEFIKEHIYE